MQRYTVSRTAYMHVCLHCDHINLVSLGKEPKNNLNLRMHLEGDKSKVPLGNWLEAPHRKCSAQRPWQGCIPAQSGTCRAAGMGTLFWDQQSYPGGCAPSL